MAISRAHACDRVLSHALQYPWAITGPMLSVVANILGHRLAGDALDLGEFDKRPTAGPQVVRPDETQKGVAILPIHGVLAPRMNVLSDISGGASYEQGQQALAEAMRAADVGTIVLDFDSPGGSVVGAQEFARDILKARTQKRIIAHAHYEMCSAAYWLGSCATEIVAAPSAMVGSIGVYSIHEDLSKALDELGVKVTHIFAGKYKVDGNEAEPLSDSARARLQALVDQAYGQFVGDVAKGRGVTQADVRTGFGQGTTLTADEALHLGMVDSVGTLDDILTRVLPSSTPAAAAALAAGRDTSQTLPEGTDQDRVQKTIALQRALWGLGFVGARR